ncbi:MAG TPA: ankyrin repeat domain-containing protein [Patescibacteria group bacterium]|nr:ankyrin repeat domain-containing protein [Patescibacteria group bacterium]
MLGLSKKEKDYALYKALEDFSAGQLTTAIRKGGDVNVRRGRYAAPLFKALSIYEKSSATQAVKILVGAGADVNARDEDGRSVLQAAIDSHQNYLPLVDYLIEAGADVMGADDLSNTPLFTALRRNAWEVASRLVDEGAHAEHTNLYSRTLAMAAVENNAPPALLARLFDTGLDVNHVTEQYASALSTAAAKGSKAYIDILLKQPDIEIEIRHPVDNNTPLMAAVISGRAEAVKALLDAGARTDVTGAEGATPLVYAATAGHNEIFDMLLASGATLDRPNKSDVTAITAAAGNGNIRMVMSLLAAAQARDSALDLGPGLLAASGKGHGRVMELLIEAGADVNIRDKTGRSPLMHAALDDRVEALEILLRAGAKADLADTHGMSAYDHAVSAARSKAKEFLGRYRGGAPAEKAAAPADDYRYVRLNDHSLEVREGAGLTMTFNFWTQQVILRDTEHSVSPVVQNFDAIQRQEAIAEAYEKLKAMGGTPPEPRAASVRKKSALG